MSNFDLPKMEVPEAFSELAEKGTLTTSVVSSVKPHKAGVAKAFNKIA
jgi:hypothetical protein